VSSGSDNCKRKSEPGSVDLFIASKEKMKELIENIRANLDSWGELTEVILNSISLFCIVAGIVLSLVRSIRERKRSPGDHPLHTYFRMTFGGWLVVALEFQLAADIVGQSSLLQPLISLNWAQSQRSVPSSIIFLQKN
jgi:uncharacterized membrane protein